MNNELYHHGVLGMKWGVRRYQNADGSLTAKGKKKYLRNDGFVKSTMGSVANVYSDAGDAARKIGKATHTRVGTNMGANVGAVFDASANQFRQLSQEKSARRTLGNLYGSGAGKATSEALSKAAGIKSKNAYTRLGGRWAEQRSHNYGYNAQRSSQIHSSVTAPQWVSRTFKTAFSTPYERLSGRTTSRGAEYANYLFTGGLYGVAADISYLRRKKKNR